MSIRIVLSVAILFPSYLAALPRDHCTQLIIGLGTGRCGTKSLAEFLSKQADTHVTHEFGDRPVLPWKKDEGSFKSVLMELRSRRARVAGDVGFYHLPYVEDWMRAFPRVRFVVLQRARSEVVRSFSSWSRGRNHWMNHNESRWRWCVWDRCFPKFDQAATRLKAIAEYWDYYYKEVSRLGTQHPDRFFRIETRELNNADKLSRLLDFLDYREKNIQIVWANRQ